MAKKIGIAVAVILVAFLGFVATRPSKFHLERSAVIQASPETVFAFINNMKNRRAWYPWDRLDPNMKVTYNDVAEGVGSHYAWEGNDAVGKGEQRILESVPNQKVVDLLHFMAPMEATNTATFAMAAEAGGTKVTWGLDGENGFGGKLFSVFMDMDTIVGKDFEQGLTYLNEVAVAAEAKKKEDAAAAAKAAEEAAKAPVPVDPGAAPAPASGPSGGKAG